MSWKSVDLTVIKVDEVPGKNWLLSSLSVDAYQFHIAREVIHFGFFFYFLNNITKKKSTPKCACTHTHTQNNQKPSNN